MFIRQLEGIGVDKENLQIFSVLLNFDKMDISFTYFGVNLHNSHIEDYIYYYQDSVLLFVNE